MFKRTHFVNKSCSTVLAHLLMLWLLQVFAPVLFQLYSWYFSLYSHSDFLLILLALRKHFQFSSHCFAFFSLSFFFYISNFITKQISNKKYFLLIFSSNCLSLILCHSEIELLTETKWNSKTKAQIINAVSYNHSAAIFGTEEVQ